MIDLLILFAVAMAVSAIGWKYFVYFFSLGYGYGIAALAVAMCVMYHANLTVPTMAMLVLLFIFGVRLGTYLLVRERKAAGYRKILYGEGHSEKKPAGVMIMIWLFCALLYVAQVSPVAFRLANGPRVSATRRRVPPRKRTRSGLWIPVCTVLSAARTTWAK